MAILLLYGAFYYGGLYQNTNSLFIGIFLLILMPFVLLLKSLIPTFFVDLKPKAFIVIIITFYVFLSSWTIFNSPKPSVDTFFQFSEAPKIFLRGENPYASQYTKVYKNITPNYFPYLPFSFVYIAPFIILLFDPRFGIVFANVISAYLIYLILRPKNKEYDSIMFVSTFLFFPRSFYMVEHMYLDPIIFMFFLLSIFLTLKKKDSFSTLCLSLFLSFKQNLFFLLPLIIKKGWKKLWSKNLFIFTIPFLLIVYFFLFNQKEFIRNTILYFNPQTVPAPIHISLSLTTFLSLISFSRITHFIYIVPILFFLLMYIVIYRSSSSYIFKIALLVFSFTYAMYQSFYNHYYFVAQFLFLDIIFEYLTIKI